MPISNISGKIPAKIIDFFASVRLSIFLFAALALSSVIGTLLPQDAGPDQRLQRYGPKLNAVIEILDLADLYHSWWFRTLLLLLAANLVVCSLRRLPKTIKAVSSRPFHGEDTLAKMKVNATLLLPMEIDQCRHQIDSILRRRFRRLTWQQQGKSWRLQAERGILGRFGVYGVHLGVAVILAGAMIGSVLGFRGFVTIPEGKAVDHVFLNKANKALPLGFQVRCDKFSVEFYDTGAPKEFRSDLSILENGKVVERAVLRVNQPYTHRGITFYQSSYGNEPTDIVLRLRDVDGGDVQEVQVPFRRPVTLPGGQRRLVIMDYTENAGSFGPAFFLAMVSEGQRPVSGWIVAKDPQFHGNRLGPVAVAVVSYRNSFYTGLQVRRDPGTWMVYTGFVLMLAAMVVALYVSHQRLWLVLRPVPAGTQITIAGNTNKHHLGFQRQFDAVVEALHDRAATEKRHE